MYNSNDRKQNRRNLRLSWYVTASGRPELCSSWSLQDSPMAAEGACLGPCEPRNQPVTEACETETIAACA